MPLEVRSATMPKLVNHALVLLAALLLASCSPPAFESNWYRLQSGMTKVEVETILGTPSAKVRQRHANAPYAQWWQYGNSLSTFVTGIVFPDAPPDEVFGVYFDAEGRVTDFRRPLAVPRSEPVDVGPR